ncbi:amino acid ABC transporter ATP-binding protein [Peptacetobacter hiranonis]|uniref:amino acid ABC transporter ATP-binding protein n=1 Tax=Peptacetobacter hiranonis TaxID=89152 RepID=UPI0019176C1D|nr:amino acid ABC transporter ATP-binding protein [Peptacetobacter hiranonis]QQQ87364.1 amino acid ABC transporter ATP-binding protein [Peptacetobacter hiranonis]
MIEVINLKKKFKDTEVLKDISFDVKDGEIAVVVGKSGAGKTTLMRCINGLEEFDSGELVLNGESIKNNNDMKKVRGNIGMVFQNFNLFPHMTVIENIIEAPVNVFGENKEEALKKANELLKMVDLADKGDNYPFQLSGGQQQRVAIARACALKPDVICFDEPTSALDPESIQNVIDVIKKLKENGMAIIIVTHDIGFCDVIADKIIRLESGIIKEVKNNN